MSRGTRVVALAVAALLVVPAAPAAADDPWPVEDGDVITLTGDGSGHGRGMSQYGAYSAGRKGVQYRKILSTYYPNTRVKQRGGSLEVLVSADDDNDLVVQDVDGLKVRAVDARRTWQPRAPRAKRWRIKQNARGVNVVSYFAGSWRTWRKIRGEVELSAGSKPLTLSTPEGRVSYRGALRSSVDDFDDRVTVNVVSLEHYARGVVPSEMQAGWPQQALRSQAVASRTYGAWRRAHPLDVAYDICDTALCQVYGGASAEASATDRVVRATANQVLTFRRKPIFAEFSASNGGFSVDGGKPYLPAKRDRFEGTSRDYYGWTVTVNKIELEEFYEFEDLTVIQVSERDGNGPRGGRVTELLMTTEGGDAPGAYPVIVERFRRAFGLPTTLFTVTSVD